MTGPNPILAELGPIEGLAHRAEHAVADRMRDLMRINPLHHHDAPQPAALAPPPAVPDNDTQEVTPMPSLLAEIEDHAKAIVAKFEAVDREALAKLDAVTANPATSAIFEDLAAIAHLPLTSGELTTAENVLKMTLGLLGGTAQPTAESQSGPVVAGQA